VSALSECGPQTDTNDSDVTRNQARFAKQLKRVGSSSGSKLGEQKVTPASTKRGKGHSTQEKSRLARYNRLISTVHIEKMEGNIDFGSFFDEEVLDNYASAIAREYKLTRIAKAHQLRTCNKLECNYHLANKKAMFYNLKYYYEAMKENPFEYIPLTFHIQEGVEDKEFVRFTEYFKRRQQEVVEQDKIAQAQEKTMKTKPKKLRNIWIIKPGENTNRGTGISVSSDLKEIRSIVGTREYHVNGKKKTYIIQQYLDRPFLYNRRKFDIRCYMLLTSVNGKLKAFWYQEGYIRTSCKEFTVKNLNSRMVHLTNDAVQKKSEEYGKFEPGNKVTTHNISHHSRCLLRVVVLC
jgi:tubulin monoglycylase TTLL3/8